MKLRKLKMATALVASLALASGCGASGGGGATGDNSDKSAEDIVNENVPDTGITHGPKFDLAGVKITATTALPGAINIGTLFAYKRLEEWGAEVDTIVLTTTSGAQTLIAGRADIASQGSDELVLSAAEGANMVGIGATSTAQPYVLVADNKVGDSIESLKGKTVGMSGPSGFDALLTRLALDGVGLDPKSDAKFVQIGGSPDRATALLSGQVDAATIFLEDWEEISRKTDKLHLVKYMAELVPDVPAWSYFAEASYWKDNPEVALALACANLEANNWINEDKDRYVDYVRQLVPSSTEEALSSIYDSAQKINMWPTDPDKLFSPDGLKGLISAMADTGEIKTEVDPAQISDLSYLQKAESMGCK